MLIDHRYTLHTSLDKLVLALAFSVRNVRVIVRIQSTFNHLSKRALHSATEDQLSLIRDLEEPHTFVSPATADGGLRS
jgi:hypothetical protein